MKTRIHTWIDMFPPLMDGVCVLGLGQRKLVKAFEMCLESWSEKKGVSDWNWQIQVTYNNVT